jgi:DnaJ family protein B protein 4
MFGQPQVFFHAPANVKPPPLVATLSLTLDQAFTGCSAPLDIERIVYNGRNREKEFETFYVEVPEGIDNNEVITIERKGNVGADFEVGDLRVVVQISNPTKLVRHGLDLVYTHPLTLKEALCGFSFELEYLHGKILKIANQEPNIVSPNFKKRIEGMGMKRDKRQGSLIIAFSVAFPTSLSSDQIELLKAALP